MADLTWDERYKHPEYIYGKEPNLWFKTFIDAHAPGRIFLPGEGEGRNAVYAAVKGWTVDAADQSPTAREKALKLAEEAGVTLNYTVGDILETDLPENTYDAIALIYLHKTPGQRERFYPKLIRSLQPGGWLVLEAFNKKQIAYNTGGPKDLAMLFSEEELRGYFSELDIRELFELQQELTEGLLHQGMAETIRMTAVRKKD